MLPYPESLSRLQEATLLPKKSQFTEYNYPSHQLFHSFSREMTSFWFIYKACFELKCPPEEQKFNGRCSFSFSAFVGTSSITGLTVPGMLQLGKECFRWKHLTQVRGFQKCPTFSFLGKVQSLFTQVSLKNTVCLKELQLLLW